MSYVVADQCLDQRHVLQGVIMCINSRNAKAG
jgi:hypothetical protein